MSTAMGSRADHFLQRDDVGVDRTKNGGNAFRPCASVETAAAMNVVGGDSDRADRAETHCAIIVGS